jgi:hypothetical protein
MHPVVSVISKGIEIGLIEFESKTRYFGVVRNCRRMNLARWILDPSSCLPRAISKFSFIIAGTPACNAK